MPEHNHILRGDVVGCPSCDVREGRAPDPMRIPTELDYPRTPDHVKVLPVASHSIRDGRAVCNGDRGSKCHWYPGDDCEHESWPCGHEYVAHDECWIIQWLDAVPLEDTATDDALDARDDELTWPDGDIDWEFDYEWVTWWYLDPEPTDP